jgi:fructose-1,6-bisphosphatase
LHSSRKHSIFINGRKELRKPGEISTVEFVVQLNGTARSGLLVRTTIPIDSQEDFARVRLRGESVAGQNALLKVVDTVRRTAFQLDWKVCKKRFTLI